MPVLSPLADIAAITADATTCVGGGDPHQELPPQLLGGGGVLHAFSVPCPPLFSYSPPI